MKRLALYLLNLLRFAHPQPIVKSKGDVSRLGLSSDVAPRLGEGGGDIAGGDAGDAVALACDFPGQTVEVGASRRGLEGVQPLGAQGRDGAHQHIPRPRRTMPPFCMKYGNPKVRLTFIWSLVNYPKRQISHIVVVSIGISFVASIY